MRKGGVEFIVGIAVLVVAMPLYVELSLDSLRSAQNEDAAVRSYATLIPTVLAMLGGALLYRFVEIAKYAAKYELRNAIRIWKFVIEIPAREITEQERKRRQVELSVYLLAALSASLMFIVTVSNGLLGHLSDFDVILGRAVLAMIMFPIGGAIFYRWVTGGLGGGGGRRIRTSPSTS